MIIGVDKVKHQKELSEKERNRRLKPALGKLERMEPRLAELRQAKELRELDQFNQKKTKVMREAGLIK
jgi:hypothetical protein